MTRRVNLGSNVAATIETTRYGTVIVTVNGERRFYPTEAQANTEILVMRLAIARGDRF